MKSWIWVTAALKSSLRAGLDRIFAFAASNLAHLIPFSMMCTFLASVILGWPYISRPLNFSWHSTCLIE